VMPGLGALVLLLALVLHRFFIIVLHSATTMNDNLDPSYMLEASRIACRAAA
jgi:hypothetical protein